MTQLIKLSAALIAELVERRLHGRIGQLPTQRPDTLPAAFAVQQAVASLIPSPIIGWKCGMPSSERWVLAPLYQTELQAGQYCALWPDQQAMARVEPELCFVLKRPLPARVLPYTPQEIDAAIGATHIALELIQSRYASDAGATFLDQLADGLFNQGLWLGPAIDGEEQSEFELRWTYQDGNNANSTDLNIENTSLKDAETVMSLNGKHPNLAPRLPLYWLVNFLSAHQIDLNVGQMIITGSYAGVLEFPLNELIHLQFGSLGQADVMFCPRRLSE